MSVSAIGVFDSGLGGLTCVKKLLSFAPSENIVYFGDTARVPYGNRSVKTISKYASQAIDFLISKDVKLLIDACGTMSSSVKKEYTDSLSVPYIDVIEPAAKAAVNASKTGRVGIIATAATVKNDSFSKSIKKIDSSIATFSKACPLFVPLVENGYTDPNHPITKLAAEEYLNSLKNERIDTLVLGCTHYPIIGDIISKVIGEEVTLIDSGAEAAKKALAYLDGHKEGTGSLRVYISDNPIGFIDVASVFLGFIPKDISEVDLETIENGIKSK